MTATPIPRTAAMTVYGDLDVACSTSCRRAARRSRHAVGRRPPTSRRRAATVRAEVRPRAARPTSCARSSRSRRSSRPAAAEETLERLSAGELAGLRLGLLHGRMPSAEKEAVMARSAPGELDVLVATTVIEVGVDVPNATVMVDRATPTGSASPSSTSCAAGSAAARDRVVLLPGRPSRPPPTATPRLEAMVRTTDGFELAEVDLELRGEGNVLAARQSGSAGSPSCAPAPAPPARGERPGRRDRHARPRRRPRHRDPARRRDRADLWLGVRGPLRHDPRTCESLPENERGLG